LCNYVIGPAPQSTDEQLRKELLRLSKEALSIKDFYSDNDVLVRPVKPLTSFGRGEVDAPRWFVQGLVESYEKMFPVYRELRSFRVRDVLSAAKVPAQLPFTGDAVTLMVEEIAKRMQWLQNNAWEADTTVHKLSAELVGDRQEITMGLGDFQRLRSWISSVFYVNNKVHRLWCALPGKWRPPAAVSPAGWALMGVGALGLGYVLYRLTGGGS
jgi:hypothetical protein